MQSFTGAAEVIFVIAYCNSFIMHRDRWQTECLPSSSVHEATAQIVEMHTLRDENDDARLLIIQTGH